MNLIRRNRRNENWDEVFASVDNVLAGARSKVNRRLSRSKLAHEQAIEELDDAIDKGEVRKAQRLSVRGARQEATMAQGEDVLEFFDAQIDMIAAAKDQHDLMEALTEGAAAISRIPAMKKDSEAIFQKAMAATVGLRQKVVSIGDAIHDHLGDPTTEVETEARAKELLKERTARKRAQSTARTSVDEERQKLDELERE